MYVHVEVCFRSHVFQLLVPPLSPKIRGCELEKKKKKKLCVRGVCLSRVTCTRANQFLKILVYLLLLFLFSLFFFFFISRRLLFVSSAQLLATRVNSRLPQLFVTSLNFKFHFRVQFKLIRVSTDIIGC